MKDEYLFSLIFGIFLWGLLILGGSDDQNQIFDNEPETHLSTRSNNNQFYHHPECGCKK
jgi:hypothetical protein